MKTWLLIWNPSLYPWDSEPDGYNVLRSEIAQVGCAYAKWSCGQTKSIMAGDRIFLIRLHCPDRGIVASGTAATDVFEGPHWDPAQAAVGKKVRRIYVKFDTILNHDANACLPYDVLQSIDPAFHWSPYSSGVGIPDETARLLEIEWAKSR